MRLFFKKFIEVKIR